MSIRFEAIESKLYEMAAMFETLARQECQSDHADLNLIHWYITEARRAGNLPRAIKLRSGERD